MAALPGSLLDAILRYLLNDSLSLINCDTYTLSLMLLGSVSVDTVLPASFCPLVTHSPLQPTPFVSIHAVITTNSTTCVLDPLARHPAVTGISSICSTISSSFLPAGALTCNSEHTIPDAIEFAKLRLVSCTLSGRKFDQFVMSWRIQGLRQQVRPIVF